MSDPTVPIGVIAEGAGLSVSTVRYYDRIGLITTTGRVGGKRRFTPETVGRVSFIRRAQDAGFSLDEIGLILDDQAGRWRELVDEKLAELRRRQARLDTMIGLLTEISHCGCDVVADCPRSGV